MYITPPVMRPIWRTNEAYNTLAISKSTFFNQQNEGLICKPIALGARCVGYLSSEIIAVLNARIQGKTDYEIKTLVIQLELERQEIN